MQCFHYKTATGNDNDKPRLQKDILSVIFDHSEPQVFVYGSSSAVHRETAGSNITCACIRQQQDVQQAQRRGPASCLHL